jgi:hypothetical protein
MRKARRRGPKRAKRRSSGLKSVIRSIMKQEQKQLAVTRKKLKKRRTRLVRELRAIERQMANLKTNVMDRVRSELVAIGVTLQGSRKVSKGIRKARARRGARRAGRGTNQRWVIRQFAKNEAMTPALLVQKAKLAKLNVRAIRQTLYKMVREGQLQKSGKGRSAQYRCSEAAKAAPKRAKRPRKSE